MKKAFVLIIFLFGVFISFGQFQRMLIPKNQSPIVLKPGIPENVKSICLDYILDMPNKSSDFSKILSNSDAVIVTYTKTGETKFLSEVLGKDVLIKGIGEGTYKHVRFINNSDEDLKITFKDVFQIGEGNQTEATVYNSTDQHTQWLTEIQARGKEMGYSAYYEKTISQFKQKNPDYKSFSNEEYSTLFSNFLSKKLKSEYEIFEHQKRIEKAFKNSNIGIDGNVKQLLKEYKKATGKDVTRKNILKTLKEHIGEKYPEYYILDEEGNYITYYKSRRISGILYKKSRYVTHYITEIEDALFAKNLNKSNLEIVNFITEEHDSETYGIIDNYFKNNNTNFSLPNLIKLKDKVRQNQIEYIVFYGHFEGDELCQYVNGERLTYSIEHLRELAKDLEVKAIFAGCSTSISSLGEVSGFTEDMNSLDLANILFNSLNEATSLGDFLKKMAGESGEYIFTFAYDNEKELIRVKFKKKNSKSFREEKDEKDSKYKKTANADQIIIEFSPQDFFKELTKEIAKKIIEEVDNQEKETNE